MNKASNTIECPQCKSQIDVNDVLSHQIEDRIRLQMEAEQKTSRAKLDKDAEQIQQQQEALAQSQKQQSAKIAQAVEDRLKAERIHINKTLRKEIQQETSEELALMKDELDAKSKQVKELHKATAEIERLKRANDEILERAEADAEKKLSRELVRAREGIQKTEFDKQELRFMKQEKIVSDLRNQIKEAHRKAEQGSVQLQGEVQELAIEDYLKDSFPLDEIREIKKGARGGDCLQFVHTHGRQNCGVIYYESKRTKEFSRSWITKFKDDIRAQGANVGVLVTEAMPNDMPHMGQIDGIWICTFADFKGLSKVLRESVIQVNNALAAQVNKGDKMELLYDFLSGDEFRMHVEGIVEAFTSMQDDLTKEKNVIQRQWVKRQKQIEKVVSNTINMYGSLKGIAGNAIQEVALLEFDAEKSEDEFALEELLK